MITVNIWLPGLLAILILAVVGLAHIISYLSNFRLKRVDEPAATKKIDVPPQT